MYTSGNEIKESVVMTLVKKKENKKMHTPQRCRDGVMSDFVPWCRHLFVPSFFMK